MDNLIFISYKHEQPSYALVNHLCRQLSDRGYRIWFDKHINGGKKWREEIDSAIEQSFLVLVIMTPAAAESNYVIYEWAYAMGLGKTIIPILLEGNDDNFHPRMTTLQYRDFRRRYEEEWDLMLEDIERASASFDRHQQEIAAYKEKQIAVKRIASYLSDGTQDVELTPISAWDSRLLHKFFELAPLRLIEHLRAVDILGNDVDADSGYTTLVSRMLQIDNFSRIEMSVTMTDQILAKHLFEVCNAILFFEENRTQPQETDFIDYEANDIRLNAIQKIRDAYKTLVNYVSRRYPGLPLNF